MNRLDASAAQGGEGQGGAQSWQQDSLCFLRLKQFLGYKSRVGHGPRVPRVPWKRVNGAMPLVEGRKEGAREATHVASLRPESEPSANLAAQTEVVDELGPD